jgi:hypothetical protein
MQEAEIISLHYGGFRCDCLLHRIIRHRNDGIYVRISGCNSVNVRVHNFNGGNITAADQAGQLSCVCIKDVLVHYYLFEKKTN